MSVQPKHQKGPGNDFLSKDLKVTGDQQAPTGNEQLIQQAEELVALKDALRTSQEELFILRGKDVFLQSAFENTFLGIAAIDLKGRFIQVNKAFCAITGYLETELLTKTHLAIIHPDDKKNYEVLWKNLMKNKEGVFVKEIRYQGKLEEIVWVRNSVSLLKDNAGNPQTVMLVSINIQEEKRAHQKAEEIIKRFRFLADSMPQQIWTADADGNLNYFSQAFYNYSGTTYNDIKDSNWTNIVYADDMENTDAQWKEAVESGNEFQIEHRLKSHDGSYKWQFSRALPQRDDQGKVVMWVGSTTNIHNQKIMEEQLEKQVFESTHDLREANFNLKHSNKDLEQFAYIATHDLKEPLRKIRTYSSWINKQFKKDLPEEVQDYMIKIENASERMSKLIDDLLAYSILLRPQEAFENTDLNVILDHVLGDFDLLINEKNAVVNRMHLPSLKAVPIQMQQLFYNLLSNALKFTVDDKQPVINITSRILTEKELLELQLDIDISYVEIIFSDNGIGFQQEYAEKVFTIFKRLNSRKKFSGTGIGLALCQKIVLYHYGRIYVKTKENEGAAFYVLLPLTEAAT
ncbi:MAG: PAS domain S-box protein [Chitinophagaceae bacterium]